MKFYTFLLVFEPVLNFRTSVIRGVVKNQVYLLMYLIIFINVMVLLVQIQQHVEDFYKCVQELEI